MELFSKLLFLGNSNELDWSNVDSCPTLCEFYLFTYTVEALKFLGDIPAVTMSTFIQDEPLPNVTADNVNGMRKVTEYLISLGHKKILFLGSKGSQLTSLFRERALGYLDAVHEKGLPDNIEYCNHYNVTPFLDRITLNIPLPAHRIHWPYFS